MGDAFTFAVIADSHFHPPGDSAQSAYPSDAVHNARNAVVVELLNRAAPDFVIHVGDVPHPVPGLAAHARALDEAARVYGDLRCPLYVVPGNHDIGDKPHPLTPAPRVSAAARSDFARRWGPPWQSFAHRGCRFVLLDTPVLNTGSDDEARQWTWLAEVCAGGERMFAFQHYPPFLDRPDEAEHYDNLAEPARARLLALLENAEAVFCGHVHHFFYRRFGTTDLVILPATSFVRPGYTELVPVAPVDEFGRNDAGRLGFLLVHVEEGGLRYEPVRTDGAHTGAAPAIGSAAPCAIGVTLRHGLGDTVSLPADNLDPFVRKRARNDLSVWAAWDLGLQRLRLPLSDLEDRARLEALVARGLSFVFVAAGHPDWEEILRHGDLVEAIELVLPRPLPGSLTGIPEGAPPIWVSAVGAPRADDGVYFSHFPRPGLGPEELAGLPAGAARGVVRVPPDRAPWDAILALDPRAVALVELPRAGEGTAFVDDAAVARRVAGAWAAAVARPGLPVLLDGFVDHDRGYHPRHGLVDRRYDGRPAYRVLRALARTFGAVATVRPEGQGAFRIESPRAAGVLQLDGPDGLPVLRR